MVTLWNSSFWNQPLCSSLVVQLHLKPKAVLKRRGDGGCCRWVVGGGYGTGRVPLDALAALHLWFILSRLHLDGHHIVAWWHVIVSAVRHLLLGYDPVDFCRTERDIDAKTVYSANNPRTRNEYGLCVAIKAYKLQLLLDVMGEHNYSIATDYEAFETFIICSSSADARSRTEEQKKTKTLYCSHVRQEKPTRPKQGYWWVIHKNMAFSQSFTIFIFLLDKHTVASSRLFSVYFLIHEFLITKIKVYHPSTIQCAVFQSTLTSQDGLKSGLYISGIQGWGL